MRTNGPVCGWTDRQLLAYFNMTVDNCLAVPSGQFIVFLWSCGLWSAEIGKSESTHACGAGSGWKLDVEWLTNAYSCAVLERYGIQHSLPFMLHSRHVIQPRWTNDIQALHCRLKLRLSPRWVLWPIRHKGQWASVQLGGYQDQGRLRCIEVQKQGQCVESTWSTDRVIEDYFSLKPFNASCRRVFDSMRTDTLPTMHPFRLALIASKSCTQHTQTTTALHFVSNTIAKAYYEFL